MSDPSYTAAIFDMDGLLLDSERVIRDAWLQVARRHGVALDEADYLQTVGRNEADTRVLLTPLFNGAFSFEQAREAVEALLSERDPALRYPAKPGAAQLLDHLRRLGVTCGVASSTRVSEVRRRLEHAQLLAHFGSRIDSISGGDEVARGKPHPDLFLLASERIGVEPRRCLAFEDSEHGAQAALAAGMSVVIVPDLKAPSEAMRARCVAVLASLEQAVSRCESWFAPGRH